MALSGNILSRDLRYINGFDKQTTRQLDKQTTRQLDN